MADINLHRHDGKGDLEADVRSGDRYHWLCLRVGRDVVNVFPGDAEEDIEALVGVLESACAAWRAKRGEAAHAS